MKKIVTLLMSIAIGVATIIGLAGCSDKKTSDTLTIVWYPNESGGDLEAARNEIGDIITKATGKKIEHMLTTDYAIAIEALANDTAAIGFMGAEGYIEAHTKNENVIPLAIASGKSGTVDDAVYYSWISVPTENQDEYKKDGNYTLDNIVGKKMSFVSNSSTSGFKVPTSGIISYFSKQDKWKDLTKDDLIQGGSDKFFSDVLYGGSHQGSAVNLVTGKADVAAFCDANLFNYVDVVSGKMNEVGTVYKIKDNAAEPFNEMAGKKFTAITSTPVLNAPFVMNTSLISEADQTKLIEAFTSDETTNNAKIFLPKDSTEKGFFKKEGKEKFLEVEDAWFDPIRNM
ncbi:PhnD/SsuA/transferrin family substrate-binding protein [Clostridium vincentii]|uniref:Phosphate-import protein PhnD n=1 Tax=Clostridium vincentii TaxID=52704 RepID=A0A2T0BKM1_9CLOT|nr:PhnD/SsuA/transferrin family substrate-binding protein [Clostridium vincentii]PRR84383.1 Phosphate-import protein PhnD precursor [Clostridium vincentii]